ncbi:MAG: alpha/beta hydrolase [Fusobacterium gastrosuis]|uniref:esterase/lipase family protein n=1 Tax=Fusobacterium gastrosuis TaxID=1755100 RepID=UPI002979A305|nr:alpha/beta hydrolase [Fusobacteriaceae bacterium]MDY4010982.1 alpha/beta hydrolase [Fusobacterium gastrosuis]MDY5306252.1 alpha/beta hydrolase [Fusobacterium gastrosuis]MDY5713295.1 alpha/beta hydrolase [Fusobacterium gastrosuis]
MFYRIVLIHGFFKTYKDMKNLEEYLTNMGYQVDNLNFPLTFPKLEISVELLKNYLLDIKLKKLNESEEIVLIAAGFGGILIRETLKDPNLKNIVDKIILISSPINDSKLLRRLKRIFVFIDYIFQPLVIYQKLRKNKIYFDENIEVGLLIGTETEGFFSNWLGEFNDGLVDLKDADLNEVKDKVLIPITHKEIHKKIGTARYINNFITKGKFKLE